MQNNGEINKGKADQNKSEPSNFETKVIRPGTIRSNLLALLDASTCFNLYSSNKYISKKMNEINDFKKSRIMYIVYLNRLGDFFGDNGKFFSDIVDKIFESDFEKLYSLISTKSKVDQEKFCFDNSRKIVSPTFKLYLKMYMTKIILLELLSISRRRFFRI